MIDAEFDLLCQYPNVFWPALGFIWVVLCRLEIQFLYTVETTGVIDRQNVQIPHQELMSPSTLAKSYEYYRACGRLRFGTYLYSTFFFTSILVFNGLYTEWSWSIQLYHWIQDTFEIPKTFDPDVGVAVIFFMIDTLMIVLLAIPPTLIRTFVIEANYNFNTLTWTDLLRTLTKIMVCILIIWPMIGISIGSAFAEVRPKFKSLQLICQSTGECPILLSLTSEVLVMICLAVYIIFPLPFFNLGQSANPTSGYGIIGIENHGLPSLSTHVRPIQCPMLRNLVWDLAVSVGFPPGSIYEGRVWSGSRHAGAKYSIETGSILISDSIIENVIFESDMAQEELHYWQDQSETEVTAPKLTTREVLGILAHEIGHWKDGHGTKIILYKTFMDAVLIVILFASYEYVFPELLVHVREPPPPGPMYAIYSWVTSVIFGPKHTTPVSTTTPSPAVALFIGLVMIHRLLKMSLSKISEIILNIMSRRFELAADAYAVALGYGEDLQGALVKLHAYNLMALNSKSSLVSPIYSGHHTLLERIEAIRCPQ